MTPQQKKMVKAATACRKIVVDEIRGSSSAQNPFHLIGKCMAKEMRALSKHKAKRATAKRTKRAKRGHKRKGRR